MHHDILPVLLLPPSESSVMPRSFSHVLASALTLTLTIAMPGTTRADDDATSAVEPDAPGADKPVSFLKEVAPVLVQNCIACHNPKKSESKYVMTTFSQLAKGGQQG